MENLVARLHGALVEALQSNRSFVPDQPVTVAEIYQDLIPYRSVRSSLGFALNADYEHALLQLLSGQGELARIEPREVRDQLRLELESPNPNVGMFRNYAACDVFVEVPAPALQVRPLPKDEHANGDGNGAIVETANGRSEEHVHSWEAVLDAAAAVQAQASRESVPQRVDPAASLADDTRTPTPARTTSTPKPCGSCREPLPQDRDVRFCPFCGHDQSRRLCPACRADLESGWRFCVSCGTAVSGATGS